jgi:hypothetical protein
MHNAECKMQNVMSRGLPLCIVHFALCIVMQAARSPWPVVV